LVSSSGTGALCFWHIDLASNRHHLNYMLSDHKGSVRSIHFAPDGQILFSGGADETIRLWEVDTGKCLATLALEQPYAGMQLTNATGLTAAQRAACKALGALE
jgi:WD40 repeat protein